ncbi:conserved hypothetical protein [Ricinus communis]|uniref:Protein ApaG n=1 Tax=Ricinus communis TaxID=3988 RepID=B9RB09_RICCO|nr:conserved hypothetical protein [Ricinus communis]
MHSLASSSIKVFTDFNTGRRTCFPVRSSGFDRRIQQHQQLVINLGVSPSYFRNFSNNNSNSCRIVACSVERNGNGGSGASSSSSSGSGSDYNSSSFASRTQTYAFLKQQMEVAAQSEDYEEAARIRDSLRSFEEEEPDAVRYRDELKEIAPHSLLKCSSDATTLGIRVQVRSVYIDGRSQPSKGQYFFAYRIRITNNSDRPVQLLRRHWIISDANGRAENVWGIGVIGEQPVILPRTGFEYSSACPLSTPSGRMEGDFEMKHIDRVGSSTFNVAIAPFSLSILADESDTF